MNSSPTQTQVAGKLGVSQALVLRALSGRAGEIGASPATVEKIRRTAAEWNCQPSATALALLGAPTRMIGVVVKNFDDPYFGRLIGALQSSARDNRHSLLLTGSGREDLSGLQRHRVDAVILAVSDFQPEGLAEFARKGMPVVQIGTGGVFPGAAQIHMDEESGINGLLDHLAGLGHREIGFVVREAGANRRCAEIHRRGLRARGFYHPGKIIHFIRGDRWTGCRPRGPRKRDHDCRTARIGTRGRREELLSGQHRKKNRL